MDMDEKVDWKTKWGRVELALDGHVGFELAARWWWSLCLRAFGSGMSDCTWGRQDRHHGSMSHGPAKIEQQCGHSTDREVLAAAFSIVHCLGHGWVCSFVNASRGGLTEPMR
jgi:hypothetical protein